MENNISKEMIELLNNTKEFYGVAEIVELDFEEIVKLEDERDTLEGDLLEEFDLLLKVAKRLDYTFKELCNHYNEHPTSHNNPKDRFLDLQGSYVGYIFLEQRRREDSPTEQRLIGLELDRLNNISPKFIDRVTAMNLLSDAMDKEDITVLSLDYVGFNDDTFVINKFSNEEANTFESLGQELIEYQDLYGMLEENGLERFFNYEDYGYHEWRYAYDNGLLYKYSGYGYFIPHEQV